MFKKKKPGLVMGALLNWTSMGLNVVLTFASTPIVIHKLGMEAFGMWALIQSFTGYYGLVNLGLGSALQQFISRDLARNEHDGLQRTVGTAIGFFTITGAVVLLAASAFSQVAADFFEVSKNADAFSHVILLCALSVIIEFYGALYSTLINGKERFDLSNGLSMARQIVQTSGVLISVSIWPTIYSMALSVLLTSIAGQIATVIVVKRLHPNLVLLGKGFYWPRLREMLHFGTSTVLITISNILRLRLGNAVIAKTTGLEAVTLFSIATSIIQQMNSKVASSLSVLNPRFTQLHTQGHTAQLQKLFRTAVFFSSCLACFFGTIIMIAGKNFILLWVGPKYLVTADILHILALGYVIALSQNPSWNLMFALNRHHTMARIVVAETACTVALGIWLSSKFGAIGFAYATASMMIIVKVFIHIPYAANVAGLKIRNYAETMLYPFVAFGGIYAISRIGPIHTLLEKEGVIPLIITIIVSAGLYGIFILLTCYRQDYFPEFLVKRLEKVTRLFRKRAPAPLSP
ncbi:MAG: oligosaccharide flippase family protein [Opitutaceae bacterium]|nr:oligosaccharide flippase family protein [Opitutaceae bacterium]